MTMDGAIAWKEAENDSVRLETEGYCVLVSPKPVSMELTTVQGRVLERADEETLNATPFDDERKFTFIIEEIAREGHRYARGTEQAINAILGAAETGALSEGLDFPFFDSGKESEDDMISPETAAVAAAVGNLAERLNSEEQQSEAAAQTVSNPAPEILPESVETDVMAEPDDALTTEATPDESNIDFHAEAPPVEEHVEIEAEPTPEPEASHLEAPTPELNHSMTPANDFEAVQEAESHGDDTPDDSDESAELSAQPATDEPEPTTSESDTIYGEDLAPDELPPPNDFLLSAEAAERNMHPPAPKEAAAEPDLPEAPAAPNAPIHSAKEAVPSAAPAEMRPANAASTVPTPPAMPVRPAEPNSPSPVGFQQPVFEPKEAPKASIQSGQGLKKVTALGFALGRNSGATVHGVPNDVEQRTASRSTNGHSEIGETLPPNSPNGTYKPWG